ncbi:Uncharacterized protein conserved in bacteria [Acidipropionibacterium jensenii]|uniref:Uncharacterized protein conserved in bacteria n=1 Tax=Acidipropionibacterium jensenii TaxID=1749 RepID=A0A448NYV2_9ACTN|nr:glycosyltransferase [Acidipropionibacterium jensenii]VEI03105.1 Uncharacterized protein conserved in bacteria [Acidipropionibacterium jensenii]
MTILARVCHLSTAHPPRDNRIFRKECVSLAAAGADVWFIGAQGDDEVVDGVHVVGIGKATGRLDRLTRRQARAWHALDRISPDVVHVHDPELIPMVLAWKALRGRAAVYDAHEDLVGQIEGKKYLPDWSKPIARLVSRGVVRLADRCFDGVIAATSTVMDFYRNPNRAVVRNYPLLSDYPTPATGQMKIDGQAVYVGMLSAGRQVDRMFETIERVPGSHLTVAGLPNPEVEHFFENITPDQRVEWLGRVDGSEVPAILASSWVGIAFFQPIRNYQKALPTKLFEYMAAGIPFISTNLDFLVQLFGDYDCGVFVDTSQNAASAAAALTELLADPERSRRMGENGRRAFERDLTFESQIDGLLAVEGAALKRRGAVLVEN